MFIDKETGLQVVTANEILRVTGIRKWPISEPPMESSQYLGYIQSLPEGSPERERRENHLRFFMPRTEAAFFTRPDGKPYTLFRTIGNHWATVFTILPGDLVLITVEFKGGVEEIIITPPAGVPTKEERDSLPPTSEWNRPEARRKVHDLFASVAKREYLEETGFEVRVELIGNPTGVSISSRGSNQRYFMFLGHNPRQVTSPKPDETEFIETFLTPLAEWLEMLDRGIVLDACAHHLTYQALRRLGRLTIG